MADFIQHSAAPEHLLETAIAVTSGGPAGPPPARRAGGGRRRRFVVDSCILVGRSATMHASIPLALLLLVCVCLAGAQGLMRCSACKLDYRFLF